MRSDLRLDVIHQILQAAFDWTDSHLHRFALGGGPFDRHSQVFLARTTSKKARTRKASRQQVWLDETLQEAGDVLRYVYDYGYSWQLTLRLKQVLPCAPNSTLATCIHGGSLRTAGSWTGRLATESS